MKNLALQEQKGIKGRITLRSYKAGTKELIKEIITDNLIMKAPSVGIDLIIQRLIGDTTYSLKINYGAIGTGSTAPAVTDTQLATESVRVLVTPNQQNVENSQAKLQFFFPDGSLSNGTYYEFGAFVDGTASANSGKIFDRALFFTPYVKASGTDTTIELDISIT